MVCKFLSFKDCTDRCNYYEDVSFIYHYDIPEYTIGLGVVIDIKNQVPHFLAGATLHFILI